MSRITLLLFAVVAFGFPAAAQQRTVAITIDDLPYAGRADQTLATTDAPFARKVNRELLRAFKKHRAAVTGFVNEKRIGALGSSVGSKILKQWVVQGFDLGNHTYSHSDINILSVPQIEDEITRGEATFVPLVRQAGRSPEFFRFPMNHTGDTRTKHDTISVFLVQRGYKLATCTIENSDYIFNDAYIRMLENKDSRTAEKLRIEYLAYTSSEIDYYASLNKRVLGYEPPEVMLLHANRLNAEAIDNILELFEKREYKFVSLGTAQSDAAYGIADTFITPYGPMWGYRWAREKNVHVDGRLEPEPPPWVFAYLERANKRESLRFTVP
jgi:peptidoglycan-N-acetylglucosamine deacetylase